ncbi:DUF2007 domain-containing protein [Rhodopirellula sp. JC740]|uniref:DUF2007 domain-containing protein n=1 Tax=Rhodopirellula halodulae TaxID=2894198 RepID=A0ABS8NMG9_9BACT|nr:MULTISPECIES: DUF2007 domain-containing protein [unclassified Rhodopirellula]MCC9644763.1 DUF2007 domain-containing protein [Rhodopirellula sp. JC740]MCC9658609.1 DUF2007 domain-containing protein [Rhodopirellula sp. JC737]
MTQSIPPHDPNQPADPKLDLDDATLVTVAERSNEPAATVLVSILADAGIRAVAVGGFTAGFRAEAPGWVQVKTLERDAEEAKRIIAQIKQEPADFE